MLKITQTKRHSPCLVSGKLIDKIKSKMQFAMASIMGGFASFEIEILNFFFFFENCRKEHCVKCIRIRSFPGLCFPTFGLNTERYSVFNLNAEKHRPEKTLNTDTFYAVDTLIYKIKIKIFNFNPGPGVFP